MRDKSGKRIRQPGRAMLAAVMLFFFLGFFLLALKDGEWKSFLLAVLVPLIIFIGTAGISRLFPSDQLLLALTNFLCALGVLVLYRLDPEKGMAQAENYGVGVACMVFCTFLVRFVSRWKWLTVLMVLGSAGLLILPLVFGRETNGAKNWIYIGSHSLQPSEIVKLALLLCVSWLLSQRRFLPALLFCAMCLGL
ncbi:MAG: FtsW/RodA/SpoVE family cell cycle protein, partial [Clostridia bacterium]|nr:FtsW/RodA/SpoVE family cell cycle protein [Clostridia bacterium]